MQGLFALARLFLNRCCDSYSQGWIDFKKLQFTILSCRFKMFLPCVLKPNGERGGGRVDLARLRLIGRYMGIQGSSLDSPLPHLLKRNKNVFKACMAGIRKKGGGVGRIGGSGENLASYRLRVPSCLQEKSSFTARVCHSGLLIT